MDSIKSVLLSIRGSGLTQTEIARRTGISQSRLSRWENGEVPAGADDALKLVALQRELIGAEGAPDVSDQATAEQAGG